MIIDLLTQKCILSSVSYYDSISSNMINGVFSVKTENDILSWRLTNSAVSSVEFIFTSDNSVRLEEINYEVFGGNDTDTCRIYTSIDYINWYELPYKKDDKYVYRSIGDNYVNLTTYAVTSGADLLYAFKKFNTYSGEYENIYDNLEFKYIKIVVDNIEASTISPVYFNTLSIMVEDFVDEKLMTSDLLQVKADMYYKQKVFEDETFYPDIINNYLAMLEVNGNKNPDTTILDNEFNINTLDEIQL